MSYLVLARKCRPKLFHEVVGQQHITRTLQNSILSGRIAHSFLFTGPRGVGKTTTARILAKSLNCQNLNQGEPCNACSVCQDINQGSFVDVLEIDGASNNSVDDIRDLREKVRYAPTVGRRKIYIIDEVHMLSTAAFNALLKTLEEPPDHVIFIFATTEPHKIPATILSRCQRFDFRRLHPKEITDALQGIVSAEGWEIPMSVLSLIARSAEGSMRDAQSILDQVISCSEGDIKYNEVLYLLGMVKKDQIYAIWEAVFNRRPEAVLSGITQVLERGYDLRHFAEQLLHYLRDLLVYKTCPKPVSLLDMSEEEMVFLERQSQCVSLEDLQQYFHLLAQGLDQMRGTSHPQIILEMTLVHLAKMKHIASFADILQRLTGIEKTLGQEEIFVAEDSPNYLTSSAFVDSSAGVRSDEKISVAPEPKKEAEQTPCPEENQVVSEYSAGSSQKQKWAIVREKIKKEKKTLAPIIQQANLDSITERIITISFPKNPPFYLDTITQDNNKSLLQKWCQDIFGADYQIECRARDSVSKQEPGAPSAKEDCTPKKINAIIPQYPIIQSAVQIFSAKVTQSQVSFRCKN